MGILFYYCGYNYHCYYYRIIFTKRTLLIIIVYVLIVISIISLYGRYLQWPCPPNKGHEGTFSLNEFILRMNAFQIRSCGLPLSYLFSLIHPFPRNSSWKHIRYWYGLLCIGEKKSYWSDSSLGKDNVDLETQLTEPRTNREHRIWCVPWNWDVIQY